MRRHGRWGYPQVAKPKNLQVMSIWKLPELSNKAYPVALKEQGRSSAPSRRRSEGMVEGLVTKIQRLEREHDYGATYRRISV